MRTQHHVLQSLMALGVAIVIVTSSVLAGDKPPAARAEQDAAAIAHVLNRVAYGPRPGDIERVQAIGLSKYVDQQLHPERIDDSALDTRLKEYETLRMSTGELAEKYFLPALQMRRDQVLKQQRADAKAERSARETGASPEMTPGAEKDPRAALPPEARMAQVAQQRVLADLTEARMLRAALSERQLQEVLTDFWFNHFNVFVGKGQVRQYLTSYERDAIRPNVLGHFRTLLGAVAHSPAMLFYLDNFQSAAPNTSLLSPPVPFGNQPRNPQARRRLMERMPQQKGAQPARPARGLNENYAREIMELHTLGVDGGYTQADVIALARILTGWTIDRPQQGGEFVFRPQIHDNGTKTFLGVTFAASGEREGEQALDMLARHPATAHHIAYQLAQRFVADEPPAGLVDRTAKVFLDTKGDLREVVRAIITSPEFFAAENVRAKVKTPLEFVVSAVRATGADLTSSRPLVVAMRNLGMPLYGCQPPTGYSMTSDAWVNTGALLNRMNFAVQLVSGGRVMPTEQPGRGGGVVTEQQQARREAILARRPAVVRGPIAVDLPSLAGDMNDAGRTRVIGALLNGDASDATRQTLARAGTPQNLVALALGSPEFQRR